MSTNPNNAVGTNGAYGGRTSVKAFNDVLGALSGRGVLSGWAVSPDNGMTISVGGVAGVRDVAIGEDNNGNRTTINNISEAPISLNIPAAPSSNSRIDSIVLYVDNPPQGTTNAVDNPAACGLIVVSSDIAGTPTPPSDVAIRAAITADGAAGSTAFFCVVADISVTAGLTDITTDNITMKEKSTAGVSKVTTDDIEDGAVTSSKIDFTTFSFDEQIVGVWVDGRTIYRKTISCGALPNATSKDIPVQITDIDIGWIDMSGSYAIGPNQIMPLPFSASNPYPTEVSYLQTDRVIRIVTNVDRSNYTEAFVTLRYTKTA